MEWRPHGIVCCHAFEQAPAARYGTAGADGGAATVTAPEMMEIPKSGLVGMEERYGEGPEVSSATVTAVAGMPWAAL